MKDEIENILGNINFEVETEQEWLEPLGLDRNTWKQILDYITNLQKENKQLKEDYNTLVSDNCYVLELERKIDKAIEYIKDNDYHYMNEYALERFSNNLLEILGDKE